MATKLHGSACGYGGIPGQVLGSFKVSALVGRSRKILPPGNQFNHLSLQHSVKHLLMKADKCAAVM